MSRAPRATRSAGAGSAPLDVLVERAGNRPVYLVCAAAVAAWRTDMACRWLGQKYPSARFQNSRGLYGNRSAWLARWPQHRGRWGAGIVLTTAEPLDEFLGGSTGGDIPGLHVLADGAVQEIVDLAALGRPLVWLAMFEGRLRQVATFVIEQPEFSSGLVFARLFHAADAEPFVPVIGRLTQRLPLSPPLSVAALVSGHGAGGC